MSDMEHPVAAPMRVVIGDFGAVARNGLRRALAGQGFEVVVCDLDGLGDALTGVDAVVVDLETCGALADRLAADHPKIRVIGCSAEEPRMRVFSSTAGSVPLDRRLTMQMLARAVRGEL